MSSIRDHIVKPQTPIHEIIKKIDELRGGLVLVVDNDSKLVGTITDGDVRRHILKNGALDQPCEQIMGRSPQTALVGTSNSELLAKLQKAILRSIPLVDKKGVPKKVVNIEELTVSANDQTVAVIMAGGEGKRLRPFTENTPKPMMEVGGEPILKRIVDDLRESGIHKIFLSINYKGEVIEEYFADGSDFGVSIDYLREDQKLGTCGALSLLPEGAGEPVLVMNADLVTKVDFKRVLDYHRQHKCVMSIAAAAYHVRVPYGVLKLSGSQVIAVEEKPVRRSMCNAGIYVLEPELLALVANNKAYDMTELIAEVLQRGLPVTAFPIFEYWTDIGKKNELRQAQKDFQDVEHNKGKV